MDANRNISSTRTLVAVWCNARSRSTPARTKAAERSMCPRRGSCVVAIASWNAACVEFPMVIKRTIASMYAGNWLISWRRIFWSRSQTAKIETRTSRNRTPTAAIAPPKSPAKRHSTTMPTTASVATFGEMTPSSHSGKTVSMRPLRAGVPVVASVLSQGSEVMPET
ncbi:hypothetical protein D3C71_1367380 [compost metagenome]